MITFCPRCATRLEERLFEGKPRPGCPNCGYTAFADPKVAAWVIVVQNKKLLLTRRAIEPGRGLWCFPGGYVDFGEDPQAAAIRECREETGLIIDHLTLLDVAFNGRVIVITYTAEADVRAAPVPADDADAVGWFAPDDLPPLAFTTMYQAIEKWQAQTDAKAQRRKDS